MSSLRDSLASCTKYIKRHAKIVIGVIAGLVVGGAGSVVFASIPDSNGVIHACYLNATGTVRIIDSATTNCNGLETAITWSQTGPQGAQGATGPQGPEGPGGFTSTELTDADFTGASLHFRDMSNMDLQNSIFREVRLYGTDLHGSNLSNTAMDSFAYIIRTDLHDSDLTGGAIGGYGSYLQDSDLSGANFTDVTVVNSTNIYTNNDFSDANFTRTFFNPSEFGTINFSNSNFSNADFVDTSLLNVDLTGATLTGATWDNVTCPDNTNSDNHSNTCVGHLNP